MLTNGGLAVALLPVPSAVRVAAAGCAITGLAGFVPLLFLAIRASRRAKAAPRSTEPGTRRGPAPATTRQRSCAPPAAPRP